jgi:hypothetical protein
VPDHFVDSVADHFCVGRGLEPRFTLICGLVRRGEQSGGEGVRKRSPSGGIWAWMPCARHVGERNKGTNGSRRSEDKVEKKETGFELEFFRCRKPTCQCNAKMGQKQERLITTIAPVSHFLLRSTTRPCNVLRA